MQEEFAFPVVETCGRVLESLAKKSTMKGVVLRKFK